VLAEIGRMLRPDGRLVATAPARGPLHASDLAVLAGLIAALGQAGISQRRSARPIADAAPPGRPWHHRRPTAPVCVPDAHQRGRRPCARLALPTGPHAAAVPGRPHLSADARPCPRESAGTNPAHHRAAFRRTGKSEPLIRPRRFGVPGSEAPVRRTVAGLVPAGSLRPASIARPRFHGGTWDRRKSCGGADRRVPRRAPRRPARPAPPRRSARPRSPRPAARGRRRRPA
jgi:SAM-dependent methyltransferase